MPYDPTFIPGCNLRFPQPGPTVLPLAFNSGVPVERTRFSILFHQQRKLAVACAGNVDGERLIKAGTIKRKSFIFDPDVPKEIQLDNNQGYRNNVWDRGHLVRRRALHWGELDEATSADRESSYWTNIAPQHERLHQTAWGSIEDWLLELADDQDKRMAVFVGPVLLGQDPEITNMPGEDPIKIPAGFWKIVAFKHLGKLRAAAFLVWQRDHDRVEPVEFDPVLEQVRLTTIEYLTDLNFPDLRLADPLRFGATLERGISRGIRTAAPEKAPSSMGIVTSADSIVL